MPSLIDYTNMGLVEVGANPITSLTQNIKSAGVANLIVNQIIDVLLTDNTWLFSLVRNQLAADAAAPIFGYNFSYSRPADMIRLTELNGYAIGAPSLGAVYNDET